MRAEHLKDGFRLGNRRWYPWLFVALSAALVAFAYAVEGHALRPEWVISILGGTGGLTTFLYTQHLQETRLFSDLFREFNDRYKALNEHLNAIVAAGKPEIDADDRKALMDYFNLCAEEYLYFKAGYIDPMVWRSWGQGMRFYAQVPAIRSLWERELEGGSYYGFSLRELG